jgi:hypothetical protein
MIRRAGVRVCNARKEYDAGRGFRIASLKYSKLHKKAWHSTKIFQVSPRILKQRNKHLQTTLIEAAKMAPRNSPELVMLYDQEKQKGNANRATLAVARKLVAYLTAVDRGQRNFQIAETSSNIAA